MKREGSKAAQRRKVATSDRRRNPAHPEGSLSSSFDTTTETGRTQQIHASRESLPVVPGSDPTISKQQKDRSGRRQAVSKAPAVAFDAISVAELIEACRAHVANLAELADTTTRALLELYDYELDEPELWQCCRLVRQVLKQAQTALLPLGIVSHDTAPWVRAEEIAVGCETQQQWLRPAVHVIRATLQVLLAAVKNHPDEVLPALRDLERGLLVVIEALERVIQRCPWQALKPVAR